MNTTLTRERTRAEAGSDLLDVRGLKTYFRTMDGVVKAVDGVDMMIKQGQTLGVVGESGCGKSVTSLSIMRLVDKPGWIAGGRIAFKGKDLLTLSEEQMRHVRGDDIAMIFQEPMTSLNPVYTVGNQVMEAIREHRKVSARDALEQTVELFRLVGIPSPERRVKDYPHNMSGGMRQRVMIAMALSLQPDLLIADEPTTALDVTIQAQILELIKDLRTKVGSSVLLITHDIGVVAEMADEVTVMYTGKVVEHGPVVDVLTETEASLYDGSAELYPIDGAQRSAPQCDSRYSSQPAEFANRMPLCTTLPSCDGHLSRAGAGAETSRGNDTAGTLLAVLSIERILTVNQGAVLGIQGPTMGAPVRGSRAEGRDRVTTLDVDGNGRSDGDRGGAINVATQRRMSMENGQPLVQVKDLKTYFPIMGGVMRRTVGHVKAVDGVSFDVYPGETLGLVGRVVAARRRQDVRSCGLRKRRKARCSSRDGMCSLCHTAR